MHDLFRREALEAKSNTFLDSTVLRPPFSFSAGGRSVKAHSQNRAGVCGDRTSERSNDSRSMVGVIY